MHIKIINTTLLYIVTKDWIWIILKIWNKNLFYSYFVDSMESLRLNSRPWDCSNSHFVKKATWSDSTVIVLSFCTAIIIFTQINHNHANIIVIILTYRASYQYKRTHLYWYCRNWLLSSGMYRQIQLCRAFFSNQLQNYLWFFNKLGLKFSRTFDEGLWQFGPQSYSQY